MVMSSVRKKKVLLEISRAPAIKKVAPRKPERSAAKATKDSKNANFL